MELPGGEGAVGEHPGIDVDDPRGAEVGAGELLLASQQVPLKPLEL